MAVVETLRPTRGVVHDPTGNVLTLAYDADPLTWANILENVEGLKAAVTWDNFPSGSIPVTKRASVVLRIKCGWSTTDTNDKITIYIRPLNGDAWTMAVYAKYPGVFNPAAYVDVDVTDLMGTEDLANADVQVLFGNGATGDPDDPDNYVPHGT